MDLTKVDTILKNVVPKLKVKFSSVEKSYERQWRDYMLNPSLESPLKKQLDIEIIEIILASIFEEKCKLYQLMLLVRELELERAALNKLLLLPKEDEDFNSSGTKTHSEVIYFEYTFVLILMAVDALLKELDNQITMLMGLDRDLINQIDSLDKQMNNQIENLMAEFSRIRHEGILFGAHPRFIELLRDYSFRRSDHTLFHGELGRLIHRLYREEHGLEPSMSIINSIRNRIHQRIEPIHRLGGERQELIQEREVVCTSLEECRRIKREAVHFKSAVPSTKPGHEAELVGAVNAMHERLYQIPKLKLTSRRKREDEESKYNHRL